MTDQTPIILFGPQSGKTLSKMYPELKRNPKFKDVSNEDLLFAWYVGCKSSPIDEDTPDITKYTIAASKSIKDESKRRKYANFDVPETVKVAVEEFRKFSPDARAEAKKIIQKIFSNYAKMVDVDVQKDFIYTDKDGMPQTDWTGRKQYVDSAKTISEALPELIKKIEEGFGISETKEEASTKAIDKFHENKKESK